jgi:thiol-disulfide isomerase/thioredoxin
LRIALLLAATALTLAGCDRQKAAGPQGEAPTAEPAGANAPTGRLDRSHAGTAAPDAILRDPDGEAVTLADFRGKPLLVNLWATWCAPCVAEMPTLDALAAREKDLQVLALSQDIGGPEKVDAFFAERRFQRLEPYVDPDLGVMTQLGIATLPTTILYDAEGKEVWRMTGMEEWTGTRAARLLKEAQPGSAAKS